MYQRSIGDVGACAEACVELTPEVRCSLWRESARGKVTEPSGALKNS